MPSIVFSLFLAQFCNVVDFMIIMPLGPIFMREFSLSAQGFGILVSVYTFACSAAGLVAFAVLDRLDRRRLFLLTFVFFLLCNLACALAANYWTLMSGRLLSGLSGGLLEAATFTLVGDLFPLARRGEITGKILSAFSLSSLAGVPLGLYIAHHSGWRSVFLFVAALAAIGCLTAWLKIPSSTSHLEEKTQAPLSTILTDRRSLTGLLFFGVAMVGVFSIIPFLASALVLNAGVPEQQLYIVYAVSGAASILTTPKIGALVDKRGAWQVYRVLAPMGAFALGSMLLLKDAGVAIAAVGLAVSMSLTGGRGVAAMTLINSIPPARYRAAYLSLKSTVQYAAGGCASLAAGALIHSNADGSLGGLLWVSLLSVAFTLLSLPLAKMIAK